VMEILDLNVAGDFIEMVAILMSIKARMLLPKPVSLSDEDAEDPRTELVEKLIEYKRFKEASYELNEMEEERRKLHARKYYNFIPRQEMISDEEYLDKVNLFDLMVAFRRALDNMPKVTYHEVHKVDVSVEQQSEYILKSLKNKQLVLFQELMSAFKEKIYLIVTFIALLDLMRSGKITVRQSDVFDDIRIKLKDAA